MDTITYRPYSGEHELPHIISLVQSELSEPYVVYTYRYFLHQWSAPLSPFYPAFPRPPLTVIYPNPGPTFHSS
jgi:peptide alpha-N-acetyltransferase